MASVKVNYGKDGKIVSYRLRADLGRDANGKQLIRTRTERASEKMTPAKALKAMQRLADEWEQKLKDGLVPSTEKTFARFLQDDFFGLHNSELKPTTREFYKNISVRPIEFFGTMTLSKITSLDVDRFLSQLRTVKVKNDKTLSPKTIRHIYTFLTTVFGFAEKHDLIIF